MKNEKPYKELTEDSVEKIIKSLSNNQWRFGGRYIHPYWRVILEIKSFEHDILFPGLFKTEKIAEKMAAKIATSFTKLTPSNQS